MTLNIHAQAGTWGAFLLGRSKPKSLYRKRRFGVNLPRTTSIISLSLFACNTFKHKITIFQAIWVQEETSIHVNGKMNLDTGYGYQVITELLLLHIRASLQKELSFSILTMHSLNVEFCRICYLYSIVCYSIACLLRYI